MSESTTAKLNFTLAGDDQSADEYVVRAGLDQLRENLKYDSWLESDASASQAWRCKTVTAKHIDGTKCIRMLMLHIAVGT